MTAEEFNRLLQGIKAEQKRLTQNPFDWGDGTVAWGNDGTGEVGFEGYSARGDDVIFNDGRGYQLQADGTVREWDESSNFFKDLFKDVILPVGASYLGSQLIGGLLGGGEAVAGAEALGGGEALGGISRLPVDPFGAPMIGNSAPLANNAALGLDPILTSNLIPSSLLNPIGTDGSVVPKLVDAGTKVVDTTKKLTDTVSDVAKTVGEGMKFDDILKLVTALGGAAAGFAGSKDQQQTAEKEPWKEAQPWLKALMGQGQQLQSQYMANPFNQTQRSAMDESLRLINGFSGLIPAAYQSVASRPEFRRGGSMSANRGLLDVAPSAQFQSSAPRQPSAFPSQIAGGQFSNAGGRPARLTPEQIKLINESGAAGWTF